jgi:hypothetical protein
MVEHTFFFSIHTQHIQLSEQTQAPHPAFAKHVNHITQHANWARKKSTLLVALAASIGLMSGAYHGSCAVPSTASIGVKTLGVTGAAITHAVLSGIGTSMFGGLGLLLTAAGAYAVFTTQGGPPPLTGGKA